MTATTKNRPSTIQMHQDVTNLIFEAKKFESKNPDLAKQKYEQAFILAKEAAQLLKQDVNAEPIRSELYYSASCLALKLRNNREAFELAVEGKRFCQSSPLLEELEELRIKAQF